jgi:hypothetical protein
LVSRDPALRDQYLRAAWPHLPRLISAIDRNPFRPTYGCLDRQYWHYRTADFPCDMYQEGVLALALAYRHRLPGNRWHGVPRVRELALAALRFSARTARRDGSCDDYYPYERALGAAVFSLVAAAEACLVLEECDPAVEKSLVRRARWVADHEESGRLANHHALAALGLELAARVTGRNELRQAAEARARAVLSWQSPEGWFDEYGGADPGYQTVSIDALARYRQWTAAAWLDEPLRRAVRFAHHFLHPDDTFGGEYGSRGTHHFYPHGMELLAGESPEAAELAEAHLRALAAGHAASLDDDRMFAHRTAGWIRAWIDWASSKSAAPGIARPATIVHFPRAGIVVRRDGPTHSVVSLARGGVWKHFSGDRPAVTDAGLIVQLDDGRIAVSQSHDMTRSVESHLESEAAVVAVTGPLHVARLETATPWKFIVFRCGLLTVGRFCRTLVRKLLQRRLITGRRAAPVQLSRTIELLPEPGRRLPSSEEDWGEVARESGESRLSDRPKSTRPSPSGPVRLRVTDVIELTRPRIGVRRMAYGADHQAAYVAAHGAYQESGLQSWTDLAEHIEELNRNRRVTIVREFV